MRARIIIITIIMVISSLLGKAISEAKNLQSPYNITIESAPSQMSISKLPTFAYAEEYGYFSIKVSITNQDNKQRNFMVDDDCTFASWKIDNELLEIVGNSCRKNVYENISLASGDKYQTTLRIWIPKSYNKSRIQSRIGFIEIVNYKTTSGPYWSKKVSIRAIS